MKLLLSIPVLACGFVLSGCQDVSNDTPRHQGLAQHSLPSEIQLTESGKRLKLLGTTKSEIVTREGGIGSYRLRVYRGDCTLKSSAFVMKAKSNKEIYLPSFGAQTPPLTVSCEMKEGPQKKPIVVEPVNLTKKAYQTEAAAHVIFGFGIVGAAVAAGKADARDKNLDVIGYPTEIKFRYEHPTR